MRKSPQNVVIEKDCRFPVPTNTEKHDSMNRKRKLIVEAGDGTDWRTEPLLDQEAYTVEVLRTGASALSRLQQGDWVDAVLLNLGKLAKIEQIVATAWEYLRRRRTVRPSLHFIRQQEAAHPGGAV